MAKAPLERGNHFKGERYQQFLDAGFSNEWVDELTLHHPALYDNPKAKIEACGNVASTIRRIGSRALAIEKKRRHLTVLGAHDGVDGRVHDDVSRLR
jgi:phosphate uptake regulator